MTYASKGNSYQHVHLCSLISLCWKFHAKKNPKSFHTEVQVLSALISVFFVCKCLIVGLAVIGVQCVIYGLVFVWECIWSSMVAVLLLCLAFWVITLLCKYIISMLVTCLQRSTEKYVKKVVKFIHVQFYVW